MLYEMDQSSAALAASFHDKESQSVSKKSDVRPYNFSAGPSTLPDEILLQLSEEMLDWQGCGMGVMEMSHRSDAFISIYEKAISGLRELLAVPDAFEVLFLQGGATAENAIIPMNILRQGVADYIVTGNWSERSCEEAEKYAHTVNIAATAKSSGFTAIPALCAWRLSGQPDYVHICSNETIQGIQFAELPDLAEAGCEAPLVVDCSSDIASKRVDWQRVGLAYAGAQKNLGTAGLTIVIVRKTLLGRALPVCPDAFNYQFLADNQSMFNTPPIWAIYVLGLMVEWIQRQNENGLSGLQAMEVRNIRKSRKLYQAIDRSSLFHNSVASAFRSCMNVPFYLQDDSLTRRFMDGAATRGLLNLKGHKSAGGIRASIYNAMHEEGVDALVDFIKDFERSA
jgi:phosphoserine aminotransferase